MRATNGLQTTITLGSVKPHGQAFALELSLEISLPMPRQDEHLPDQIEAYVHQAGLEVQRRLFQVLIEKADQELVLQHRHGKAGAGIQRRGTRPFTFKTIFGEVTVERSRISHNQDGTIEIPSATVWNTSHQLAITENLRARSVIRSAIDPREEAPTSASTLGTRVCWGGARSSTSCIRRASTVCRARSVPARSWTSVGSPVGLARARRSRPRRCARARR